MTVCTYWSQVLDTGLFQVKGKLPSQHILMLVFYHLPLNSCLLEVFMQLVAYHLPEWSETFIARESLFCPARELPLVTCSLCYSPIHLGLPEDFSSCQWVEKKKCCVLWQAARCCRTTSQSFLTSLTRMTAPNWALWRSPWTSSVASSWPCNNQVNLRSCTGLHPSSLSLAPTSDHDSNRIWWHSNILLWVTVTLPIRQSCIYLLS